MRRKQLAVKIFVYFTFLAWMGGVVFLIGYRARHPVNSYSNSQSQERPTQKPVASFQQYDSKPRGEQSDEYQSYASKAFEPMALLTALLVVGVGITAYIYWRQLKKMEETVALVGKQGKTMHDQLAAMEWQAGVSEIQAGLLDKQVKAMRDGLAETRTMVEQNERAVKAAEDSARTAEQSMIYAQRAYVAVINGQPLDFDSGFQLAIQNSGNTPAMDVAVRFIVDAGNVPPELPSGTATSAGYEYIGLLAPHAPPYLVAAFVQREFTSEETKLLEEAESSFRLWCTGEIWYEDIFNQGPLNEGGHTTKFCFYREMGNPMLRPWVVGNEAD
jgi:hypothetical protein